MARPSVTDWTLRAYERLPEAYRVVDEANDWALLRLLAAWCDTANPVGVLIDRLDPPRPAAPPNGRLPAIPRSALADPLTADEGWLAWLSQFVGALTQPGMSRDRQALAATAFDHGSNQAIEVAVRATLVAGASLSGTRFVLVRPDPAATGEAIGWSILVEVYRAQTPSAEAALRAALLETPATHGLRLLVRQGMTWDEYEQLADRPTWDEAAAANLTWTQLGETVP